MPPHKLPSVLELRALFADASCDAGGRPTDSGVSGASDPSAGAHSSGTAPPSAPSASQQPQHHALQPHREFIATLEKKQDGMQAGVRRLSSSRSSSSSQHGLGCSPFASVCSSEGAALPPPRLPLQPYGEQVSAQLRRRALEARALLEEMQAQLPELAGGGRKPRLPSSALRFCKALAFVERRKAGLLAGWTWGTALLIRRLPGGAWSAPLFLRLRCGSLGLTLGGQRLRAVYVLQKEEQVAGFARRAGTLALDTAMPAELDPLDVYAPAKPRRHRELSGVPDAAAPRCALLAEGLLWDLSLRAGFTYPDRRLNSQLYGETVTPDQVLGGHVPPPPEFVPLYRDIDARAAEAQATRPALSKFELARRQSQQFAEWSRRGDHSVRGGEPISRRGSLRVTNSQRSTSGSVAALQETSLRGGTAYADSFSQASGSWELLAGGLGDSPLATLATAGPGSTGAGGFKLFADVAEVEFEPTAEAAGRVEGPDATASRAAQYHAAGPPPLHQQQPAAGI